MIDQLFKHKTNHVFIQLLRYTFVGGLAFIFDFGSLYILTEKFSVHYLISAAIAFLLGLTINYGLSISWVFDNRSINSRSVEFLIFTVIGLVGLVLNEFIIWFFTTILNTHYLSSKLISAVGVYLWNFFIRRYMLFR